MALAELPLLALEAHEAPEGAVVFRPQEGPQERFLSTAADLAIIGGSVYGGKTWSLVYEPLRWAHVPGFTWVCFRRVVPEIHRPGGLWSEAMAMYPYAGAAPRQDRMAWAWPSGAEGRFSGLQYESDVLGWKGAQVCLLEFDQLEEFTAHQFWYLLSRNRSLCGVRPYVRASCNPDPDSWVREFLAWWIDEHTGYAIPERSGVLRWFVRWNDTLVWGDSRLALRAQVGHQRARYAKSVTFILARMQDNPIGLAKDPTYEATMRALPTVEQERLLGDDRGGNWNIRATAGAVFNSAWLEVVEAVPTGAAVRRRVRSWDKAATRGAGDWTVGLLLVETVEGVLYVADRVAGQWDPGERDSVLRHTATADGKGVTIRCAQDPGAAGVSDVSATARLLAGYTVHFGRETGDKVVRAGPVASQARAGNVKLARGAWNAEFCRRLNAFPTPAVPDDDIDALSQGYEELHPAGGTAPALAIVRPVVAPLVSPYAL